MRWERLPEVWNAFALLGLIFMCKIDITQGATHDSTQAIQLVDNLPAENLLADKAYDSDEIRLKAKHDGIKAVIPRKQIVKTPMISIHTFTSFDI